MIVTAACAVFAMSAFNLVAEEAAKTAAGDEKAADSSSVSGTDPVASLPFAPMPMASMSSAAAFSAGPNAGTPKIELFLGYSYLRAVPAPDAGNRLVWLNGGSASIAYNLNRYLGLVADFGGYTNSEVLFTGAYNSTIEVNNQDGGVLTYLFGPRFSYRRHERFTPFAQVLFGGAHASEITLANCTFSCTLLPEQNTFALAAGGGLDVKVRRHIAIRVIQAEYLMTRFQDYTTGTTAMQNDMRLSAGIVFRFGGNSGPAMPAASPLSYSCSVTPSAVFMGDAIAASGTAVNLDPAKTAIYTWSVDGGTVSGNSSTAKIDTTNLAVGSYMLKGHVSEGSKPSENADCTAPYAVKAYEPPTVSCVSDPTSVISGASSTITATGVSPENRPLTYSYSADSGTVNGSGATATLLTGGATLGLITVTCNVADDKGQTASGTTTVMVTAPVAAAVPATSDLCSIHFDRDPRRPARVNNEAKACLDEITLNLQRSSDARLAVVGNAASGEKNGKKLAGERAKNTKAYLVGEKGIDASRIDVYTGSQDGKMVSTTLIPAGATLDAAGDVPVN
jgi:hypothetical protein